MNEVGHLACAKKEPMHLLHQAFLAILKFSVGNFRSYDDKLLLEFPTLKAGEALKERRCTLEKQARYVNAQGSVHTTYNIYD